MRSIWRILAGTLLVLLATTARGDQSKSAPDFTLPLLEGVRQVSLHDYRDRYVLVDFWASWCPPCRESMAEYEAIRYEIKKAFGERAFEVLAINVDVTAEEGRAFLRKIKPLSYPVLRENSGATQRAYKLTGMPTAFLINPEGKIEFYYDGFSANHAALLRRHLQHLLRPQDAANHAGAPQLAR